MTQTDVRALHDHLRQEQDAQATIKTVLKENPRFMKALRFFFGGTGGAFDFDNKKGRHIPDAQTYALIAAKIDGEQSVLRFLDCLSPHNND